MNDKGKREERDRALWRRLRAESQSPGAEDERAPGEMALAAYLEGRLDEAARAEVEAWLAAAPEGLDLVLAAREALSEPDMPAPEAVVRRAAALVPESPGRKPGGRLWDALGALWQPLGWSGAVAGVLLACVVGFELGRSGYDSSVTLSQFEVAEAGFVFDPADEEIL
jgi:anti-sigma factor RsiW